MLRSQRYWTTAGIDYGQGSEGLGFFDNQLLLSRNVHLFFPVLLYFAHRATWLTNPFQQVCFQHTLLHLAAHLTWTMGTPNLPHLPRYGSKPGVDPLGEPPCRLKVPFHPQWPKEYQRGLFITWLFTDL